MAEYQKVIKEYRRMCSSIDDCIKCPLEELVNGDATYCEAGVIHSPEEAEDIIMQWSIEHPIKTNRDKFKEVFGYNSFAECPVGWLNMEYKEEQDD